MHLLYDCIKKYKKQSKARFHMPGHGGKGRGLYASAGWDITELAFSDNLMRPCGVIRAAEQEIASAYGAECSLIFAGGATEAVQTAVLCCGNVIAFCGGVHRSFLQAARLFGKQVVQCADIASLAEAQFDAAVITSPDYYGNCANVEAFLQVCHKKSAVSIVDEAHGAHFAFSPLLPQTAVGRADFVVHGVHKTLPAYTGGALLHCKARFYDAAVCHRAEVCSTSPSYLVMASVDFAVAHYAAYGTRIYEKLLRRINKAKKGFDAQILPSDDFTRVVICHSNGGIALDKYLNGKGIWAEAADQNRVVLIVTSKNVGKLRRTLRLAAGFKGGNPPAPDLSHLVGKVSSNDVGVYPPGTVLVKKGEVISKDAAEVLEGNFDRLFGKVNDKIQVE